MERIKIGWAIRDVSTTEPINLPGQFNLRVSQGVRDPVYATALALKNNLDTVIFLSIDTVVIRSGLVDEIRAKVREKSPIIPTEKILINATHTHTAPGHYYDFSDTGGPIDFPHGSISIASSDAYRHYLADQASDAVCEAYESMAYGGIAYGYGYAVVAHSRRVVYFDDLSCREGAIKNATHGVNGHAAMYGETNDAKFSHYEAGANHFLNLLFTYDKENRLSGAIVNIPCPSQNSETSEWITADYWADVREALHKKYGPIYILPQCAAAGDLSPRILHYKSAQSRRFRLKYGSEETEICARKDIAERVAAGFEEVLSWAGKDIYTHIPLKHITDEVQLSRRLITDQEYEESVKEFERLTKIGFTCDGSDEEQLRFNSTLLAERWRHKLIISRYESQKENLKLPMELHVIRIGNIAFASNRFELYMDYELRIQARSPFEQTFVVQLAGVPGDGGGSYLCTKRGEWGKGYSASRYCNLVSPEGGQELVDQTVNLLNNLWNSDGAV